MLTKSATRWINPYSVEMTPILLLWGSIRGSTECHQRPLSIVTSDVGQVLVMEIIFVILNSNYSIDAENAHELDMPSKIIPPKSLCVSFA